MADLKAPEPSLWARAQAGETSLMRKLNALTDEEWAELTVLLTEMVARELERRGLAIYRERSL